MENSVETGPEVITPSGEATGVSGGGRRFDFAAVAREYDETVPFFSTVGQALVEWADIQPTDRVLDVGAGRGAVTFPVLQRLGPAGSVLAVDVSEPMMSRLAAVGDPRLATAVADVEELTGLPDGHFDVVTAGFVLHIVADRLRALTAIRRVLRPGGRLVWSMPGAADDGGWGDYYGALFAEFAALVDTPAGMGHTAVSLPDAAAAAGFIDEQATTVEVHLSVGSPAGYWDWLMSHGNRWLFDALSPADGLRFQQRVLDGLSTHHRTGGRTLELAPTLHRTGIPAAPARRL